MHADLSLCGWRVRSAIPLPELMPWRGDDRTPDITVSLGRIDDELPNATHEVDRLAVDLDGTCQLVVPGVAIYRVSHGRDVVIAPAADPLSAELRLFLLGTVFGVLCHQRGVVPLHASCVRIGDETIAIAGRSGIGKSSFAAALWRSGCQLISDDICVIARSDASPATVLPAFPRLRLWKDGVSAVGLDAAALPMVRHGVDKYSVPLAESFEDTPTPLSGVYFFTSARQIDGRQRLEAPDAFMHLRLAVYRRHVVRRRRAALFAALSHIAQDVPQWLIRRPDTLEDVGALATTVMHWHRHA